MGGILLIGRRSALALPKIKKEFPVKKSHLDQILEEFHQAFGEGTRKKSAIDYGRSVYEYMGNIVALMPGSVYWMNRRASIKVVMIIWQNCFI